MYPTYNKTPYYQLIRLLCYFSSKITFSGYLLLYAFFCTILTHSILLDLFPSGGGILDFFRYFVTLTYFAGALLYIIIYKDFNIYIDKHIIFVGLYILSAVFSIIVNRSSIDIFFAFHKLQFTLFPLITAMIFIQALRIKHVKTIGNYLTAFALINVIISLVESKINWGNLTFAHAAGIFPDRNLFARHLVIVNSFLLINYFSQSKKRLLDLKLLSSLLITACLTILFSRSGYVMYLIATFYIIWQTKNSILKKRGIIIGTIILILFANMTHHRMKRDFLYIRNSTDIARISVLISGINMIKHSPVYGIGYRMSKFRFEEFQDKSYPGLTQVSTIHNIFITVFAEQGVFGILFYLLFNFGILYELYKKIRHFDHLNEVKNELFCFISLSLCMLQGMVYHTFDYEGLYWVIVAICIIVLRDHKLKT